MERRKLGKTDLLISKIGYGAWGIGGPPFWETEGDEISYRSIKKAYDCGINFFDTAPVYGFGHSETVIGEALRPVRDAVVIATKFGLRWDKKELSGIRRDCSKKSIREEIDLSLKRLLTDRIDLYQVHWPDFQTAQAETMEALLEIQSEGKIRYFGVSNYSLELLKEGGESAEIHSIQSEYNLLNRTLEKDLIPHCREHQIGILAYSPLASGILCGKYDKNTKFNDWRRKGGGGKFSGKKFEESLSKVEKIKELAEEMGRSCSEIAINWVLSQSGISSALVGVKNELQVDQNIAAVGWEIDEANLETLDLIFGHN